MGVRWIVVAVLIAGCYRPSLEERCTVSCLGEGATCPGDQTCNPSTKLCEPIPGCSVAEVDATVEDRCFGSALRICLPDNFDPPSTRSRVGEITTGQDSMCSFIDTSGPFHLCVIAAVELTVGGIAARGPRPLVLLGTSKIDVVGMISVSSGTLMPVVGAGSNPEVCAALPDPATNLSGAGGGAGATFAGIGGAGGDGALAMSGTLPSTIMLPRVFHGGCDGGAGGDGNGDAGGMGGAGGGAVYLIAGDEIKFMSGGAINASGGPGFRGGARTGGAGGGSGGFIGLEAKLVDLDDRPVFALGGGGAPGNDTVRGDIATGPGDPADPMPSAGGNGGVGAGADDFAPDGNPGGSNALGGGGGGGGVGYIFILADTVEDASNVDPKQN